MDTLLAQIKKRRIELKITVSDMARLLGFKYPGGYFDIETGRKKLTFIQAVKILQKLNMRFTNIDVDTFTLEKLRKYRKEQGISMQTMALKIGYKYPAGYSNIEHGRRKLTYSKALKISDVLGVPLEELFFSSQVLQNEKV